MNYAAGRVEPCSPSPGPCPGFAGPPSLQAWVGGALPRTPTESPPRRGARSVRKASRISGPGGLGRSAPSASSRVGGAWQKIGFVLLFTKSTRKKNPSHRGCLETAFRAAPPSRSTAQQGCGAAGGLGDGEGGMSAPRSTEGACPTPMGCGTGVCPEPWDQEEGRTLSGLAHARPMPPPPGGPGQQESQRRFL